jgi:hypothetical protein
VIARDHREKMAEGDAGARATAQAFRKMQLEGSVFAFAVIL